MLFITTRHMISRKKQSFLLLLSISVGVASYILFTGIMFGFREFYLNQVINNNFHIQISAREAYLQSDELDHAFFNENTMVRWLKAPSGRRDSSKIEYPTGWYQRLTNNKHVDSFASQLHSQGVIKKANISQGIELVGSEPRKQIQVSNIQDYMLEGNFIDLAKGGNRIILGLGVAKKLGAQLNDTVTITTEKGDIFPFRVIGVFQTGAVQVDDFSTYALLDDVQKINQTPGTISNIVVRLQDYTMSEEIAIEWQRISHDKVLSWDQANASIFSTFRIQDFIRNFTSLSIFIVAGFGIFNALNILISQKRFEIAILRSMGYNRFDIVRIFIYQGILLGLTGSTAGLILGYIGSGYLELIPISSPFLTKLEYILVSYNPSIYLNAFFMAIIVSFISSLLPAWHAGKLFPIDILRNEIKE